MLEPGDPRYANDWRVPRGRDGGCIPDRLQNTRQAWAVLVSTVLENVITHSLSPSIEFLSPAFCVKYDRPTGSAMLNADKLLQGGLLCV